jgi:hypothetical protein
MVGSGKAPGRDAGLTKPALASSTVDPSDHGVQSRDDLEVNAILISSLG